MDLHRCKHKTPRAQGSLMLAPLLLWSATAAPLFNWNTVPLYWYSTNPAGAFSPATAAYAATFPVVIPNGNHMRMTAPNNSAEEGKLVTAARQIKALNSSVSVYFYLNTMMDWYQYDLHPWIAAHHPEWWVVNIFNRTVCLDSQPLFNLSLPEMRAKWLDVAATALATRVFDGVFADRANPLPTGGCKGHQPGPGQLAPNGVYDWTSGTCVSPPPTEAANLFKYSPTAYAAWTDGHADMLAALQQQAGPSKVVVANNNASTGIANGRQFERWCHTDFDKATIEDDIAALQRAGRDGVIALVHAGEPCTAAALSLGLAAYLIGAGANSYFACSDGWTVTAGWEPEDRWAEYDYPLGEPTGPALRRLRTTVKGGGERVWWFNTNATSQAGAGQRT
eukprot:m.398868 g.398868  ORF g.398868 m.398868 type:complete len:393 (+) comp28375_c1_seq7:4130-5308(+)